MAITKIWPVKSHLTELLKYVSNKSKTEAEIAAVDPTILALIGYSEDEYKTEKRLYVTGVNCMVENAPQTMSALLRRNDNHSDRVAYHAVQSFDGNECDPATAHAIGVAYAQELWGGNFAVIVATHQNTFHVHNHFAICATGYDSRRFHADGAMRHRMMEVNDRLCREHGLSVCKNRAWGHSSSFVEAKMDERKQKSHREKLRDAIDQAIYEEGKETSRMKYFYQRLEQMGYLVDRRGKYLRVRPDEGKRFFRFDFLGAGYTERDIAKRMQAQFFGNREPDRSYHYQKREKVKGIYGLYLHYQYLLGVFPKTRVSDAEIYVTMREDLKKMERYSEEARLLGNNHIVTDTDLNQFFYQTKDRYNELKAERQKLRNRLRQMHDSEEMLPIKERVTALSDEIGKVRHMLSLIRDIGQRSGIIEYICDTVEYEHERRENRCYAEHHAPPPLPERNVQWLRKRTEHQEIRKEFEREQQRAMYFYCTTHREKQDTR